MAKCEACHKVKASAKDVEGVNLCAPCYAACPHADNCKCETCRTIADLRTSLNRLIPALRASRRIAKYAERKYGTWVVSSGDVSACDDAIRYASGFKIFEQDDATWKQE